jgi:hypothetical protein
MRGAVLMDADHKLMVLAILAIVAIALATLIFV